MAYALLTLESTYGSIGRVGDVARNCGDGRILWEGRGLNCFPIFITQAT